MRTDSIFHCGAQRLPRLLPAGILLLPANVSQNSQRYFFFFAIAAFLPFLPISFFFYFFFLADKQTCGRASRIKLYLQSIRCGFRFKMLSNLTAICCPLCGRWSCAGFALQYRTQLMGTLWEFNGLKCLRPEQGLAPW